MSLILQDKSNIEIFLSHAHYKVQCSPFITGLPWSGKKFWKMKNVPGQGKVREFHFQSGKFRKNEKSHGKSGNFKNFKKIAS